MGNPQLEFKGYVDKLSFLSAASAIELDNYLIYGHGTFTYTPLLAGVVRENKEVNMETMVESLFPYHAFNLALSRFSENKNSANYLTPKELEIKLHLLSSSLDNTPKNPRETKDLVEFLSGLTNILINESRKTA